MTSEASRLRDHVRTRICKDDLLKTLESIEEVSKSLPRQLITCNLRRNIMLSFSANQKSVILSSFASTHLEHLQLPSRRRPLNQLVSTHLAFRINAKLSSSTLVDSYASSTHFVITAMMVETNDGTAVVKTNTEVFGTKRLFFVDASIHVDFPTGSTQSTIMVAAEQATARLLTLNTTLFLLEITLLQPPL
ncbi:hypothetical protein BJ875DRAFT_483853 [Amylocarpus encephaloides]|uniref:Glucose-methanol-choline oxidoreductase C-terminal domain-containing protein n=1 Tax=Amylocarpus encephaloides TaxID=45428 RepID=A0A9P7YKA5_9HELO|nr:hypothetical protein BJ875DRAFT_483853 [Amylocarpus encephaloides]